MENPLICDEELKDVLKKVGSTVVHIVAEHGCVHYMASGTIIKNNGTILTCSHFLLDPPSKRIHTKISIILQDGTMFDATLQDVDSEMDIAILKIAPPQHGMPSAELGHSNSVEQGQCVISIGSPDGNRNIAVPCHISCVKQKLLHGISDETFMQLTGDVHKGVSGGSIFNKQGEIIGIILSKCEPTRFSFALPIDRVREIMTSFEDLRIVESPNIGARILHLSEMLTGVVPGNGGIRIISLTYGGAAEKAGIQRFDDIVTVEGKSIKSSKVFNKRMKRKVGKVLQIEVQREGSHILNVEIEPELVIEVDML